MAFGPRHCACCGSSDSVEAYHLYNSRDGGSDELTVWLCVVCHGRADKLKGRATAVLVRRNARGTRRPKQANLPQAWRKASDTNRQLATAFAANVLPIIHQLELNDVTSYRAIAAALNAMGVKTARGGEWQSTTVGEMLRREVLAIAQTLAEP